MGDNDGTNSNTGRETQEVEKSGVGNLSEVLGSGSQPVQATPVQPVTTSPDQAKEPETTDVVKDTEHPNATSDAAPDAAPVDNVGETEPQAAPRQQSDTQPNL